MKNEKGGSMLDARCSRIEHRGSSIEHRASSINEKCSYNWNRPTSS
ncbi:MAG: hypothetical protein AB1797_02305 [bacterium]